jgi:hypothetical protein
MVRAERPGHRRRRRDVSASSSRAALVIEPLDGRQGSGVERIVIAVQALSGYSACMKRQARARYVRRRRSVPDRRGGPAEPPVQYTVRGVPAHVDKALRRKAQERRTSLNELLRDTLIKEAEGTRESVYTDLDSLAGSWVDIPGFDDALAAQDRVDEGLWR